MAILRDYRCEACDYVFEEWCRVHGEPKDCPHCGEAANTILSGGNFRLPGHDTGYPTAADKWARRHRKANKPQLKELGIPC